MKLVAGDKLESVNITVHQLNEDVSLRANDITLLWVIKDGTIMLNRLSSSDSERLSEAGFQIVDNRIKVK